MVNFKLHNGDCAPEVNATHMVNFKPPNVELYIKSQFVYVDQHCFTSYNIAIAIQGLTLMAWNITYKLFTYPYQHLSVSSNLKLSP